MLAAGYSVIADGVFGRAADRARIEQVAAAAGVRCRAFWLRAPASVLLARVPSRRGDVSDAGPEVVRKQLETPTGPMTWRPLDASGSEEMLAREVADQLDAAEA